jgi:hypothetical protein
MKVRKSEAKQLAGITNDECLADLSILSAIRKRRLISGRRSLTKLNAGSPHWHPAIQSVTIRQNVAGLWLKYGAKSPKKPGVSAPQKIRTMRRFVDNGR